MKKKLLLVALAAPFFMVTAQWTQTGGTVKVMPNTTKYVSGNYEVKAAAATSNEGNVNVRGNFTTQSGGTFTNLFDIDNPNNYGQLIVNQSSMVNGLVTGQFRNTDYNTFYFQPIAIPYSGITAGDIADASAIPNQRWQNHPKDGVFSGTRYLNPIFSWENEKFQLDDSEKTESIESIKAYSINQGVSQLGQRLSSYEGTLTNGTLTYSGTAFSVENNLQKNEFGEVLFTYLDDLTTQMPTGWIPPNGISSNPVQANGYASNVFYFGNPYTSNLDLAQVFSDTSQATHIFQFNGNSFTEDGTGDGSGNSITAATLVAVKTGSNWGGSGLSALTVRPFHTFGVKTTGNFSNIIPEEAKTFNARSGAMTFRGADKLYQIEMNLFNENSDYVSQFYVIAHDSYQAAAKAGNEAYNLTIKDNEGFFTLQENEDGSVAEELRHNKVLINGINTSYVAKPINVVMQVTKPGTFTIKGILSDDLLSSGNRFYFEDKEAGKILEITPEFSYVFDAKKSSDDRFNIYWNGLPDEMGVNDAAIGNTLVYKDGRDYKVRFDNNWKQADIYVYNMIGQLVHVAKKVNTINDYVLPINGDPSAYIVKIIGDNGEVATKKIVK